MMSPLNIERSYPYVISIAVTLLWSYFAINTFPHKAEALLGAAVAASSVLVGFLATAKVVVFALTGSAIFIQIKKAGYSDIFISYILESVLASMAFLVWSLSGFFLGEEALPHTYTIVFVFLSALSILSFFRVLFSLFKFLKHA